MHSFPQALCRRSSLWAAAVVTLVCAGTPAWAQVKEASRIHVLVVADTDAQGAQVFGLGLDGDNVKRVFDEKLGRSGKSSRYTLELFTGAQVSPQNILNYYANLKTNPTEALVFYYTGHGVANKDHELIITTHKGFLSRKTLLAAMRKHQPLLTVMLTDCCANFAGMPPGGHGDANLSPTKFLTRDLVQPPVVDDRTRPQIEGKVEPLPGSNPIKPAEAPDLMSNLFFQHKGLVDINAAEMGKSASGKSKMGGSFFTIALTKELRKTIKEFDRNDDGFCEWREFFPALDKATIEVSQKAFFFQKPQCFSTGEPYK